LKLRGVFFIKEELLSKKTIMCYSKNLGLFKIRIIALKAFANEIKVFHPPCLQEVEREIARLLLMGAKNKFSY